MNPTKQEIIDRLDEIPIKLRGKIFSEEMDTILWGIASENHLSEEKGRGFIKLAALALIGFWDIKNIKNKLQDELHIPPQVASEIIKDLEHKILPLMEKINRELAEEKKQSGEGPLSPAIKTQQPTSELSATKPAGNEEETELLSPGFKAQNAPPAPPEPEEAPTPQQTPPPVPQSQTPPQAEMTAPQSPPQQSEPAPFVLHEETKIQPLASSKAIPLSRPQFFKSTAKEKPRAAPSTARLEIGADATPETQKVGQTKKEMPRVVNYTSPVTKVDPFERPKAKEKPAPETKEEKPPQEVSPDNIVNLKDLPR